MPFVRRQRRFHTLPTGDNLNFIDVTFAEAQALAVQAGHEVAVLAE